MLRGNHECSSLNRIYGFFDECKRRYSVKLWRVFGDCFNCMPIAAIVGDRIICMHGGLSPELESLEQIRDLHRPTEVPEDGLLADLLWSDPEPRVHGWGYNSRGVSYTFGTDVIDEFLEAHDLELICRAHQVVEDGYEFIANRKLVTIFSAPNYCGEFDNAGGMLVVGPDLRCSFKILRPVVPRRSSDLALATDSDSDLSDDEAAPEGTPLVHLATPVPDDGSAEPEPAVRRPDPALRRPSGKYALRDSPSSAGRTPPVTIPVEARFLAELDSATEALGDARVGDGDGDFRATPTIFLDATSP